MDTSFDFSSWPPGQAPDLLEALTLAATTYAFSHGLLYLPPSQSPSNAQPHIPTAAIHAPLSLFPAPFPRAQFEAARRLGPVQMHGLLVRLFAQIIPTDYSHHSCDFSVLSDVTQLNPNLGQDCAV